jgi:hypothetical protein
VHQAIPIVQLLCKLAGAMPGAVKSMKFAFHFPAFRMDSAAAVIKPLYVKLWHDPQIHFRAGNVVLILPA